MLRLLTTFLDIALWRKGPQDLPASRPLVLTTLAAYVLAELAKVRLVTDDVSNAFMMVGIDVFMLAGWSWLVLSFFERGRRFVQTLTAVLGVSVVMVVFDVVVLTAYLTLQLGDEILLAWRALWLVTTALIVGRIFMHALDRGLATGIGLTIAIVYSTQAVTRMMLHRL